MSVPAAYAAVILIWSTTPLTVKWSAEGLAPASGVLLRMMIAGVCGYLILRLINKKIRWDGEALKHYAAANLGVFVGMTLLYKAATYMQSGLISILFGLSPILSGLMSQYLIRDTRFTLGQWMAMLVAFGGLGIVFSDQLYFSGESS